MRKSSGNIQLLLMIVGLGFGASFLVLIDLRATNRTLMHEVEAYETQIGHITSRIGSAASGDVATLDKTLVWSATDGTSAEQDIQSWLLNAVRENGQTIRQYQQGAPVEYVQLPSVSFRLEFSGSLVGLASLIAQIEQNRPALAISNLQIRPLALREQRDGSTLVTTQMSVWGVIDAVN